MLEIGERYGSMDYVDGFQVEPRRRLGFPRGWRRADGEEKKKEIVAFAASSGLLHLLCCGRFRGIESDRSAFTDLLFHSTRRHSTLTN